MSKIPIVREQTLYSQTHGYFSNMMVESRRFLYCPMTWGILILVKNPFHYEEYVIRSFSFLFL